MRRKKCAPFSANTRARSIYKWDFIHTNCSPLSPPTFSQLYTSATSIKSENVRRVHTFCDILRKYFGGTQALRPSLVRDLARVVSANCKPMTFTLWIYASIEEEKYFSSLSHAWTFSLLFDFEASSVLGGHQLFKFVGHTPNALQSRWFYFIKNVVVLPD